MWVAVIPETSKIASGIAKALRDVDADVIKAARRWKREIESELKDTDITVDADTAPARKEIEKVEKGRYRAEVKVDVDQASLAKARAQIGGGGGRGGGVGLGGLAAPPKCSPAPRHSAWHPTSFR